MSSHRTLRIGLTFAAFFLAATSINAAIEISEGGYLYAEHHEDFVNAEEGMTIEGWFYLNEYPILERFIMPMVVKPGSYSIYLTPREKIDAIPDPGPFVWITFMDNDSDCGGIRDSNVQVFPDRNPVLERKWMHVALEMRDSLDKIVFNRYLNGIGFLSRGLPHPFVHERDSPVLIGGIARKDVRSVFCTSPDWMPVHSWAGSIESVRVSKGVRYNSERFAPERDLRADKDTIALWKFDRPTATYEDLSGNGHTLFRGGSLSVSPKSKLATTWGIMKSQ